MDIKTLFSKSIVLDAIPPIHPDQPNYTSPRTYGVYEIVVRGLNTKRYRYGNHPIRQTELIREHGSVRCLALYFDRSLAKQLATALNQ